MTPLSNNQKKFLRSLSHSLKPVVMIGRDGLSDAVLAEIAKTMKKHELLKIKIRSEDRAQKHIIIDKILTFSDFHLVQVIGNTVVLYQAFDKDPQVILPRQ